VARLTAPEYNDLIRYIKDGDRAHAKAARDPRRR
jgi:hypothetical protein